MLARQGNLVVWPYGHAVRLQMHSFCISAWTSQLVPRVVHQVEKAASPLVTTFPLLPLLYVAPQESRGVPSGRRVHSILIPHRRGETCRGPRHGRRAYGFSFKIEQHAGGHGAGSGQAP